MPLGATPLLERHRIFYSRNAEETRAFLGGKGYQFALSRRDAPQLETRLNGLYVPNMYFGYVHYGSVSVDFSPSAVRSDYWIQLPLHGAVDASIGRHSVICDPTRAAIASPVHEQCLFKSNADSARIQLALTKDALTRQLAALLGEPVDVAVDFAPALDLTTGYGQSLARYVSMAALDLEQPGSMLTNPVTMSMFQQLIMTGLLLSHRHNYSEALLRRQRPPAPRAVKRAIDYLEAHLDAPVTLADLVAASGVPGRTLFKHFRDSKGVPPMRYLRHARLERVRQALAHAQPGQSVTEIAMSFGFSHLGRFAVEYRRRFGESPSE